MSDADPRRLLARAVRAEEDAQQLRERLAACYREVEQVRAKIPARVRQVDSKAGPGGDPLIRLFAAIAPPRDGR